MGEKKRPAKKPAIPQAQRIKHALQDVEDAHDCLYKLHGDTDENRVAIAWNDYVDACIKLVSLDNSQLKNPLLQPLLSSKKVKGKDLLRKIHRGLEKGVKRALTEKEIYISKAIYDGFNESRSLQDILNRLTRPSNAGVKPILKKMSLENFRKLKNRLLPDMERATPDLTKSLRADRATRSSKRS